ncbi:MAG: hypothetical protein H6709_18850 [Kofleriaceae bacterium]|nr:hypothetical protein [Myxococcales bacterium]MCB9564850.1 hypothetical protein [Kofleriaceae bacterium]MCB9574148.1 hypothetical protein [Kofleriaceae bacterium]
MRTSGWIAAVTAALACVAVPGAARADGWHGDVAVGGIVPMWPADYQQSADFGGRLAVRPYLGHLAGQLEAELFEPAGGSGGERVRLRTRALVGLRHRQQLLAARGVATRVLAGVELTGIDRVSSYDWQPDAWRPGFVAEVDADSHTALDWGDVSIGIALALSVQPFGEADAGYGLGLEFVFQLGVGR